MTEEEMMEAVRACSPRDFDGHINWKQLTLEQKLDWIAESARLYIELHPEVLDQQAG